MLKILPPKLPPALEEWPGDLRSGEDLRELEIRAAQWFGVEAPGVRIDTCRLTKVLAPGSQLSEFRIWHSVLSGCDFAGAQCPEAVLDRVELKECRLNGSVWAGGAWRNVVLTGCRLDEVNLRQCTMENVRFSNCRLVSADFSGCKMEGVDFEKCDLGQGIFRGAQMTQVDFRSSQVAEIASADGLGGAILDQNQLIEIAFQMAVQIGIRLPPD